jgi:DNA-binding transcriptional LysR family regulator
MGVAMHVTLRQLQIFEAVARSEHFSRAAEQLHLTQPSVSIQMRQLSEAIGLPLFEPVGRRVRLTQVGQELYQTCREMTDAWARFEVTCSDYKGVRRGHLRLSMVTTAKYVIPRMLGPFCERYPGIDIELGLLNRDQVLERLKDNLDELYIMSLPPADESFEVIPFLDNPLVVVAPLGYSYSRPPPLRLLDLVAERFIMREEGSGTRMAVDDYLAKQRISLRVRMTLGSNEAIKQAVAGGMGLSILSRHVLGHPPANEGLKELAVEHFPLERAWYVLYRRARPLSLIATTFLHFLLRETGAMGSTSVSSTVPSAE